MDVEENNAPLILAKITIKETGAETLSDENGYFLFKNLKEGNYTLVSSFVGYETKEFKTKITPNKTNNITLQLSPSSLLLEDLVLVMASADKKETATLSNN